MAQKDKFASIADSGKPNAGRIYDFFLGGNHNFEVDRQAAQPILKLAPYSPRLARVIRWFLGEAVRRLVVDGHTRFIDFASGLPTVDHIHQVAPAGTKVIYSDIDPVTVAYGQEIIKGNPNVRYGVCPAERPEELLGSQLVTQLLGADRKVAIGFNGVAYFITDDQLHHAMESLFKWADTGSRLFLCDSGFESSAISSTLQEGLKLYEKLGQPFFVRNLKTLESVLSPWKVLESGFKSLEEWVGVKGGVAEATLNDFGFSMYGAILGK